MDPKPQAMDVEERQDPSSYAQPAQYTPPQPTPTHIFQQPQPTGGVGVVVVNQQDTRTCLGQKQNAQAWATGLFGCFEDCGSCKSIVLLEYSGKVQLVHACWVLWVKYKMHQIILASSQHMYQYPTRHILYISY